MITYRQKQTQTLTQGERWQKGPAQFNVPTRVFNTRECEREPRPPQTPTKAAVALGCEKINMVSQLILFPSLLWQTVAKQMMASMRGVRAYLKFCQEHSFTCHWLLIYSLDGPILFLWYQFLLTLLTTSFNESLYNYDCWWPVTQTWRGCHYMNIKVIHRDVGVEDQSVAAIPPPQSLRWKPSSVWLYPFKYPFSSNIAMYQSGRWCMKPWCCM